MATRPSITKLSKLVAFRCPNELFGALDAQGNKTQTIISALRSHLAETSTRQQKTVSGNGSTATRNGSR